MPVREMVVLPVVVECTSGRAVRRRIAGGSQCLAVNTAPARSSVYRCCGVLPDARKDSRMRALRASCASAPRTLASCRIVARSSA
jgi:hypothetical protein